MYWIYCLAFLSFTSLIDRGRYSSIVYKLSLIILFIFVTGNYYNGIDWINYQHHYAIINENGMDVEYLAYEPGFMLVLFFFGSLVNITNFHAVVFFSSTVAVIALANFLKKIPFRINRSLFIFITVAFILPLFNDAFRQLIAFSILLPLLPVIRSASIQRILIYCTFASLFHASVLIVFPILMIMRVNLTKRLMIIMFLSALIFVSFLLSLGIIASSLNGVIPQFLYSKLLGYLDKGSDLKIGYFAIIDLVGMILIYNTLRKNEDERVTSPYAVSAYLFFLLHLAFYTAPFLQRLLYYIFPLAVVYTLVIFKLGTKLSLERMLLPALLIMSVSVFSRNIINPYYASDFNDPKFFYSELLSSRPINIETLKFTKCMVISEFDPNFCPR